MNIGKLTLTKGELVIYTLIACQLAAWGWFSWNAGELSDGRFLVFTFGMLLGQSAAAVETFRQRSWGTFVVQVYFFVFTLYGGLLRFLQM